jgi:hypothetical protein
MLVLAGCATAPQTTSTLLPATGGSKPTSANTTNNNVPSGPALGADQAIPGNSTGNKTGGTSQSSSMDMTAPGAKVEVVNGAKTVDGKAVALKPGEMIISAKTGGRYVSADGLLVADIPPGALSKDTVVSIKRRDTSGDKINVAVVPGIAFDVDLGGASMKNDSAIKVTTKVDDRYIDEMKKRDAAFTPEKYSLSQDSKGVWNMTMPIKGATTKAVTKPAVMPTGLMLAEFGAMPLPGAVATRSLMGMSTTADCQTWKETLGVDVPSTIGDWYQLEGSGTFSCMTLDGTSWFMNVFYDLTQGRTVCDGGSTSTGSSPVPSPVPPTTADVPTHTTWDSDDPALKDKDAEGAKVRFDFAWSPQNGPTDVVADAAGLAKSFTLEGLSVTATANTDVGPAAGAPVQGMATAGMAPLELKCPKFSPLIQVDITSDVEMSEKVTIKYTLDGTEATKELTVSPGSKTHKDEFYVIVPDDADHEFKITGVVAGEEAALGAPEPAAAQVHRNGKYPQPIKIIFTGAH